MFSCTADGAIFAQPLWVPNVNIGGGMHNVIVAATMRDSVYVYDADASPVRDVLASDADSRGRNLRQQWNDVGNNDIFPDIGILGTPVIDPATKNIFVVTKTKTNATTYHQRIHSLSMATGARSFEWACRHHSNQCDFLGKLRRRRDDGVRSPVGEPAPGTRARQRRRLRCLGIPWRHCVWHGWVVGFNTSNLGISAIWNDTKSAVSGEAGCKGGIWMSGGAPAIDKDNNLYVLTGNGAFNGTDSFGDSFVKLSTPELNVLDFFTPFNEQAMQSD